MRGRTQRRPCTWRARTGAAVVGQTLNSNSRNIVFGLCMPALLLGTKPAGRTSVTVFVWLLIVTIAALVLTSRPEGLRRKGRIALLVLLRRLRGELGWLAS